MRARGSCHRIGVFGLLAFGLVHAQAWAPQASAAPTKPAAATKSAAPAKPAAATQPATGLPEDADPLALARYVDRVGDDALLARMTPDRPAMVRGLAFLAAPFMRAPERALPALAKAIASSDPDLAPAAARVALVVVEALAVDALGQRWVEPAVLAEVVGALDGVARDPRTRPDIAVTAATASVVLADQLAQAGLLPGEGDGGSGNESAHADD